MLPVAVNVPVEESYNSALARLPRDGRHSLASAPVINTVPSGSNTAA